MSTYQAKKNMAREESIEWQEYAGYRHGLR